MHFVFLIGFPAADAQLGRGRNMSSAWGEDAQGTRQLCRVSALCDPTNLLGCERLLLRWPFASEKLL